MTANDETYRRAFDASLEELAAMIEARKQIVARRAVLQQRIELLEIAIQTLRPLIELDQEQETQ